MTPIRIVVADDQPDVRDGFRLVLGRHADLLVVGEAADGETALNTVRALLPDVMLVDIRMPRRSGLEVCRELSQSPPGAGGRTKVIVITTSDSGEYVEEALRYGASGFLLKRSRPELLIEAVYAAMDGGTLISPQLTLRLLHSARTNPRHRRHHEANVLSSREVEVAKAVALGRTNAQIGAELYITAGTVKTHLANIQAKLDVRNRIGIAAWAVATGVLPEHEIAPRQRTRT